jgi:tRNA nucleotidyltransferase (CCA-adding enzyme)
MTPQPLPTQWTLEEGLALARDLEKKIKRVYNHYHVALGGSVLHRGSSTKDLDIFIYPHKSDQLDREYLNNSLKEFGFVDAQDRTEIHSDYNHKEVIKYSYNGKRVDIFFLS